MAQLFFKYGTMNSGKSLHLLSSRNNYVEQGKRTLEYTSSFDTRSGFKQIETRIGLSCQAEYVHPNMFEEVKQKHEEERIYCIFVDEAHFLSREEVEMLTDIVDELDIPVICYGLRADFQNKLFTGSEALFALAEKIEEIKTVCFVTNKKATVNMRVDDNGNVIREGEQIAVGDVDTGSEAIGYSYYVVSRKIFKKIKKNISEIGEIKKNL